MTDATFNQGPVNAENSDVHLDEYANHVEATKLEQLARTLHKWSNEQYSEFDHRSYYSEPYGLRNFTQLAHTLLEEKIKTKRTTLITQQMNTQRE